MRSVCNCLHYEPDNLNFRLMPVKKITYIVYMEDVTSPTSHADHSSLDFSSQDREFNEPQVDQTTGGLPVHSTSYSQTPSLASRMLARPLRLLWLPLTAFENEKQRKETLNPEGLKTELQRGAMNDKIQITRRLKALWRSGLATG